MYTSSYYITTALFDYFIRDKLMRKAPFVVWNAGSFVWALFWDRIHHDKEKDIVEMIGRQSSEEWTVVSESGTSTLYQIYDIENDVASQPEEVEESTNEYRGPVYL